MSLTALDLPSHDLKRYGPGEAIRSGKTAKGADLSKRRRRASFAARRAAELLRTEFGAKAVYVFGSPARHGGFTLWSDIDIAARGISPSRFFEAVGAEFKMDLVDLETCTSSMRKIIEAEGKAL